VHQRVRRSAGDRDHWQIQHELLTSADRFGYARPGLQDGAYIAGFEATKAVARSSAPMTASRLQTATSSTMPANSCSSRSVARSGRTAQETLRAAGPRPTKAISAAVRGRIPRVGRRSGSARSPNATFAWTHRVVADDLGASVVDDHLVVLGQHVDPLADQRLRHKVPTGAEANTAAFSTLRCFGRA